MLMSVYTAIDDKQSTKEPSKESMPLSNVCYRCFESSGNITNADRKTVAGKCTHWKINAYKIVKKRLLLSDDVTEYVDVQCTDEKCKYNITLKYEKCLVYACKCDRKLVIGSFYIHDQVKYPRLKCILCNGTGKIKHNSFVKCIRCEGTGGIKCRKCNGTRMQCNYNGRAYICECVTGYSKLCFACEGGCSILGGLYYTDCVDCHTDL